MSLGFMINPYDPCVTNKNFDGKQLTVCWQMYDLFLGHVDPAGITHFLDWLARSYDTAKRNQCYMGFQV